MSELQLACNSWKPGTLAAGLLSAALVWLIGRLTPSNCDDLPIDDVLHVVKQAQKDHDVFSESLCGPRGIEVLDVNELIAEKRRTYPKARQWIHRSSEIPTENDIESPRE